MTIEITSLAASKVEEKKIKCLSIKLDFDECKAVKCFVFDKRSLKQWRS